MKKNLYIIFTVLFFLSLGACEKWLNVLPKSTIAEEDLFSRERGFKEALTGIYLDMGSVSLYGERLSYDYLDKTLAQLYNPYATSKNYEFLSTNTINEGIWSSMYTLIANINNFLSWTEKKPEVIKTPDMLDLVKGEAIGLRSYLYFDLLRLWGPIFSESNTASPTLPYRSVFSRKAIDPIPGNAFMDSIIVDLEKAEKLLEKDPMHISYEDPSYESYNNFFAFRMKRMNKYAVKALLARVYLYKGDKVKALRYAKEVIYARDSKGKYYFSLVTENSSDPILSSELIFSLNVFELYKRIEVAFSFPRGTYVVNSKERINRIFNTVVDGHNDFRVAEGKGFLFSSNGAVSRKYHQEGVFSSVVKNTIPLIRLSEMYLIVSECSTDYGESARWLSELRTARGTFALSAFKSESEKMDKIEIEYRKEFYAEGQYWYFLKRNFKKTFLTYPFQDREMTESNYRFAIPNSEVNSNLN